MGPKMLLPDARFRSPTALRDVKSVMRRFELKPGRQPLFDGLDMTIRSIAVVPDENYQPPGWHPHRAPGARDPRGDLILEAGSTRQSFDILALMDRWDGEDGSESGRQSVLERIGELASVKLQGLGAENAGAVAGALVDFVNAAAKQRVRGLVLANSPILVSRSESFWATSPCRLTIDIGGTEQAEIAY